MTTLREAAALALEALEDARQGGIGKGPVREAITALRAALADHIGDADKKAEPMAWIQGTDVLTSHPEEWGEDVAEWTPLYPASPQRKPLTVEPVPVMWLNGKPLYDIPPPCKPLQWHKAPVKTEWGEDMDEALVEIDKDHTLKLYCEHDQAARVEAMIGARKPLTEEEIAYIVREATKGSALRRDGSTSHRIARAIERAHGIGGEK